jgi:hypothetical protein
MVVQKHSAKPKLEPLGMVGRCFIFWGERTWQYQGVIRGEPSPGQYLCQFFECLMGEPSTLTIIPLERFAEKPWREPGSAILFETDEHMRFWQEHVEGPRAKFRASAADAAE